MDIVKAAKVTLKYAQLRLEEQTDEKNININVRPELSVEHQLNILTEIAHGRIFADKAHRCLGWAQATLCTHGIGDLTTYRALNAACGDL